MAVDTTTMFLIEIGRLGDMLSDCDLRRLIDQRELVISPFNENLIGCGSIDLSLSDLFVRYTCPIDSRKGGGCPKKMQLTSITLEPGDFVLGMTAESAKIPRGYFGFIETRGNFARAGISISCNDGHIDSGTDGNITLEIHNHNTIPVTIHAGDIICQLFLVALDSPSTHLYHGKYAFQKEPTEFIP